MTFPIQIVRAHYCVDHRVFPTYEQYVQTPVGAIMRFLAKHMKCNRLVGEDNIRDTIRDAIKETFEEWVQS